MTGRSPSWYAIENVDQVESPALLVYEERVAENARRMIAMAGGTALLRPHIKTHKMAELVGLQMALGINKFKCATVAEAELAANCGAGDVLMAYQPVGPNVQRWLRLLQKYPRTRFSTIADTAEVIRALAREAAALGLTVNLYLDIDCGQHRCGVKPGPAAFELYRLMSSLPGMFPAGLHVYDGHIHEPDASTRQRDCDAAFAEVSKLREQLLGTGLPVANVVAGGTPTFAMHVRRGDVDCSPGTCLLWDYGYATKLTDLDFLAAALVLTRVVSKPESNRLCLDLGHKAIASENPHPRVHFPELPEAKPVIHSEEHLVVETPRAGEFSVGDYFYGIPWHICPTVALHSVAVVVKEGRATARWKVAARTRKLSI